jgi:hypothetical protein
MEMDTERSERFGVWFGGEGRKVVAQRKLVRFLGLTEGLENV